jgi:hypothetical protein
MRRRVCLSAALALLAILAMGPALADVHKDLRTISVGMPIAELTDDPYAGFACAANRGEISGWAAWRECPPDAAGVRAIAFGFDEAANPLAPYNDRYQGTKVGGHPVLLTLLVGENGRIVGLRMDTDPSARLFARKKAFLLADQLKARYGESGWACTDSPPSDGEEPVGGVFVKEHCEKTIWGRHLVVDSALLRKAGEPLADFIDVTRAQILLAE